MTEAEERQVERWAQGLCTADGRDPDKQVADGVLQARNGRPQWHDYRQYARAAIALADREAAERVAGDAVRLVDDYESAVQSRFKGAGDEGRDAARARLLRHIALAEASGAVPADLAALVEKATPGCWHWWTSCSWLRLGTDARGHDRNGTPYGQDGYVAYPYVSRSDQHPDLCIRNEADRNLIPAAVNWVKSLVAAAPRPPAAVPVSGQAEEGEMDHG